MACSRTRDFLQNGSAAAFSFILDNYQALLELKANQKAKGAEQTLKLDHWYQHELPKKIKSRAKDMHMTHDELVQTIKWKLARGKFRPNLTNLIQMNTPRLVMQETKKAFRKIVKEDLPNAMSALCNLKGVGPAMASAVLAAAAPDIAPFMADECLYALPDVDSLDYTMKEYMRLVDHVNQCVDRLNDQGGNWTPHKVELAVWAHYVAVELKPELLDDMPEGDASNGKSVKTNGSSAKKPEATVTSHAANGASAATSEEDSNLSAEDSNLSAASLPGNGAPKSQESSCFDTDETSQDTNGDSKSANGDSSFAKHSPSREECNNEVMPAPEIPEVPEVPEAREEASSSPQTLKRPSPDRDEDEEDTVKSEDAASEPAQKKLKSAEEPAAVAV